MAKLDYSFLEQKPTQPVLDYSFLEQPTQAGAAGGSDFERMGERLAVRNVKAGAGLVKMAAEQRPPEDLTESLDFVSRSLGLTPDQEITPLTASPVQFAKPLAEYIGSAATKGLFDIADLIAGKGDVDKQVAREKIREIQPLIQDEARKILGSPEMQYQGTEGAPEWFRTGQRFGWDVAENTVNMVPALALGWATRNPGTTLGVIGGQVAGDTYAEYMDKTGDHNRAMAAAKFHTAAEVIPETIPVMAILRKTKAGEATKRMLEASFGEGAQEMLTSVLQQTYDAKDLEGMSLKEAILNIDWSQAAYEGAVGFFAGTALATPGAISDVRAARQKLDQEGQVPELFNPTHRAAHGHDVQMATRRGQPVPDTYVTRDGQVIRDSNAVEIEPGATDLSMDISANTEAIKAAVYDARGLVATTMQPGPEMAPVEMPTGIEEIDLFSMPEIDFEAQGTIEEIDVTPTLPQVDLEGEAEVIDIEDQFDAGPFKNYMQADLSRMQQKRQDDLFIVENEDGTYRLDKSRTLGDLTQIKRDQRARGIIAKQMQSQEIEAEANEAATSPQNNLEEPTDAQKEAGNYKKGHINVQGFDIAIENPAGSKRRPEWPTLKQHYGYIKRTVGADSKPGAKPHEVEQVDVFVKPETDVSPTGPIYVIDQATEDGSTFDEHKVMIGFASEEEARAAYMENYTKGWKGLKNITEATPEQFKAWLKDGDTSKEYRVDALERQIREFPEPETSEQRAELQRLKEQLPLFGEEQQAAKARLKKRSEARKKENLKPKRKKSNLSDELQQIDDRYNKGEYSAEDLAEALDEIENLPDSLRAAVDKYRSEVDEDFQEFGGRGDFEQYEDAFFAAYDSAIKSLNQEPQTPFDQADTETQRAMQPERRKILRRFREALKDGKRMLLSKSEQNAVDVTGFAVEAMNLENKPDKAKAMVNTTLADGEFKNGVFEAMDKNLAEFKELAEIRDAKMETEVNELPDEIKGWEDWDVEMLNFPEPANPTNATKEAGKDYISEAQANVIRDSWVEHVERIKKEEDHSNEVVISLFDVTGNIAMPWNAAGYTVYQLDIKLGDDLMKYFPTYILEEIKEQGKTVHAILAQPPCTCFSSSGARWWKERHDKNDRAMVEKMFGPDAAEWFENPKAYNKALVSLVDLMVDFADPDIFLLENPIGRIATETGLPKPQLKFQPHVYGDPYTKETNLWGKFNPNLPTANVEPVQGSLMHKLWSSAEKDSGARSATPDGFAFSFFMANNTSNLEYVAPDITGVESAETTEKPTQKPAPKRLKPARKKKVSRGTPKESITYKNLVGTEVVLDGETIDAGVVLQELDTRIKALKDLRACI